MRYTANYIAKDVHVLATLSTGDIIDTTTDLICEGEFDQEWVNYGEGMSDLEYDVELYEDTIQPLYPDEFEFDENFPPNTEIVEITKIISSPDWEIDENSIWDNYND